MITRLALGLTLACTAAAVACNPSSGAHKHAALSGFAAYDEKADGAKLIADAQATAKKENKRVLLVFGGNWCKWCKALDGLFESDADIKGVLQKSYVVVHVDSDNNAALNEKYKNPFALGFPVLLVLDADGTLLHTQDSGALEKEDKTVGHDKDKVLAFLKQYAPT